MCATRLSYLILLDINALTIFGDEYELRNTARKRFYPPINSSLSRPTSIYILPQSERWSFPTTQDEVNI